MRITIHHTSFIAVFGAFMVDIVALQHIDTNIGSDNAAIAKTKTQEGEECYFVDPTLQTHDENISSHDIVNCEESDTCVEDDTSSLGGRCLVNLDLDASIQAAANKMNNVEAFYVKVIEASLTSKLKPTTLKPKTSKPLF
jgi:hypothetical protein